MWNKWDFHGINSVFIIYGVFSRENLRNTIISYNQSFAQISFEVYHSGKVTLFETDGFMMRVMLVGLLVLYFLRSFWSFLMSFLIDQVDYIMNLLASREKLKLLYVYTYIYTHTHTYAYIIINYDFLSYDFYNMICRLTLLRRFIYNIQMLRCSWNNYILLVDYFVLLFPAINICDNKTVR